MNLPKIIVTVFGLGYIPFAPGTFGALGGVLISAILYSFGLSFYTFQFVHIGLIMLAYIAGVAACNIVSKEWGDDPSKVVIDETLGFWISILFLPIEWYTFILAFILFRFFDILKPLGIKNIDRYHGSHAVMLDDVLAGIYTNLVLQLVFYFYF